MLEPEVHSVLAPSASSIWGSPQGCTGYPTAAQMFPDLEETDDSKDGTAAHWVGSELITGGCPERADEFIGHTAPNGVVITHEMCAAAKDYAAGAIEILKNPMVKEYGVEQRVDISTIHPQCFGTPDFWAFSRGEGILWVYDFKFGMRWVSEFENWQLITYVAGILELLGIKGDTDQHIAVRMIVAQPRAHGPGGTVRQWGVSASHLRPHFYILRTQAAEALGGAPVYRSGPHCRDCPARGGRCDAAIQGGLSLYEAATNASPTGIGPIEVGILLEIVERAGDQLDAIKTGLEEQAKAYMKNGQNVPGRVLEPTFGREKWIKPADEVLAVVKMLGFDAEKPEAKRDQYANLLTPSQIKSKFPIDSAVIKPYCTKVSTGSKVTKNKHNNPERIFKR